MLGTWPGSVLVATARSGVRPSALASQPDLHPPGGSRRSCGWSPPGWSWRCCSGCLSRSCWRSPT